jgi:DNA-binding transcriptional MocR family regulator
MMGIPELRQAIAAHYGRWHGLVLDPMTEVMVTSGGTEALTSAILAVVEPGDEVIVSSRFTIPTSRSSARPEASRVWCASNRRIGG